MLVFQVYKMCFTPEVCCLEPVHHHGAVQLARWRTPLASHLCSAKFAKTTTLCERHPGCPGCVNAASRSEVVTPAT